jgi:RNA polymerase sigma-70 factor (ECF subfamily)
VLLEHQDRRQWDEALMEQAALRLRAAVRQGRPGPYQVQAGIAALHAFSVSYEQTHWPEVRLLYDRLCALDPSPVVLLGATTCGTRRGPTCSPPSTARPRRSRRPNARWT